MRPVNKGKCPQVNGKDKIVKNYRDWRADLIARLGSYCCYCNIPLSESPQVEHVVPVNPRAGESGGQLLEWENLLLSCGACNRAKSNKAVNETSYYLPDKHNTFLAFGFTIIKHNSPFYKEACIITAGSEGVVNKEKAAATIKLLALDSTRSTQRVTDLRWKFRYEAWLTVSIWRSNWDAWGKERSRDFLELLEDSARAKGFFSIWYSIFEDVPEVKSVLLNAFPGTDENSFEKIPPYSPKPRNPHISADPL